MPRLLSVEQHTQLDNARSSLNTLCSILNQLELEQDTKDALPGMPMLNPTDLRRFLHMVIEKLDAVAGDKESAELPPSLCLHS